MADVLAERPRFLASLLPGVSAGSVFFRGEKCAISIGGMAFARTERVPFLLTRVIPDVSFDLHQICQEVTHERTT